MRLCRVIWGRLCALSGAHRGSEHPPPDVGRPRRQIERVAGPRDRATGRGDGPRYCSGSGDRATGRCDGLVDIVHPQPPPSGDIIPPTKANRPNSSAHDEITNRRPPHGGWGLRYIGPRTARYTNKPPKTRTIGRKAHEIRGFGAQIAPKSPPPHPHASATPGGTR